MIGQRSPNPTSKLIAQCSLLIALGSCAPQTSSPQPESTTPVLIEGGVVQGRVAQIGGALLAFPSAPLAVARNGEKVYAAYPYQLLAYQNNAISETIPLPGVPIFVRAKPQLLIGFSDRVYVPGRGTVAFKARDAINTKTGIFWLDDKGVNLERSQLTEGSFDFLTANQTYIYAMGKQAVRFPDYLRFALPNTALAAAVAGDLYVLTKEGIYHLTLEGLRLGFLAGNYSGLETDGDRVYTLQNGRLVTLSLDLRIIALGNTLSPHTLRTVQARGAA